MWQCCSCGVSVVRYNMSGVGGGHKVYLCNSNVIVSRVKEKEEKTIPEAQEVSCLEPLLLLPLFGAVVKSHDVVTLLVYEGMMMTGEVVIIWS